MRDNLNFICSEKGKAPSTDLWEEVKDYSIYTDILQHDALLGGIKLAELFLKNKRAIREDKKSLKIDIVM